MSVQHPSAEPVSGQERPDFSSMDNLSWPVWGLGRNVSERLYLHHNLWLTFADMSTSSSFCNVSLYNNGGDDQLDNWARRWDIAKASHCHF